MFLQRVGDGTCYGPFTYCAICNSDLFLPLMGFIEACLGCCCNRTVGTLASSLYYPLQWESRIRNLTCERVFTLRKRPQRSAPLTFTFPAENNLYKFQSGEAELFIIM